MVIATVADSDVVFPFTAVSRPVITNLTVHYAFLDRWVFSIEPTRGLSPAALGGNAVLRDLVTSIPRKAVPAKADVVWCFTVAFYVRLICVSCGTITLIQDFVVRAFIT